MYDGVKKIIEERIRILQAVRETAKPEHQGSYDTAVKTLEWVLTHRLVIQEVKNVLQDKHPMNEDYPF